MPARLEVDKHQYVHNDKIDLEQFCERAVIEAMYRVFFVRPAL